MKSKLRNFYRTSPLRMTLDSCSIGIDDTCFSVLFTDDGATVTETFPSGMIIKRMFDNRGDFLESVTIGGNPIYKET